MDIPFIAHTRCPMATAPFTTPRMVRMVDTPPPMVRTAQQQGQLRTIPTPAHTNPALPSQHLTAVAALVRLTTRTPEPMRQLAKVPVRRRSGDNPTFRTEINLPTRSITPRHKGPLDQCRARRVE